MIRKFSVKHIVNDSRQHIYTHYSLVFTAHEDTPLIFHKQKFSHQNRLQAFRRERFNVHSCRQKCIGSYGKWKKDRRWVISLIKYAKSASHQPISVTDKNLIFVKHDKNVNRVPIKFILFKKKWLLWRWIPAWNKVAVSKQLLIYTPWIMSVSTWRMEVNYSSLLICFMCPSTCVNNVWYTDWRSLKKITLK